MYLCTNTLCIVKNDIHVQLQNSLISRISSVTTGYVHHRLGCCYHHTALTSHYDYISVDCDEANQIKYTFLIKEHH